MAAYQRANSAAVADLPAPAKACSSTTGWVSNARSRASSVSSRPKNPASGGRGSPPDPAAAPSSVPLSAAVSRISGAARFCGRSSTSGAAS